MNLNATMVHIIVTGLIAMQQVTDVQTGLMTPGWRIAAPDLMAASTSIVTAEHPHEPLLAVRRKAIVGPVPQLPPFDLKSHGHESRQDVQDLAAWRISGVKVTFSPRGKMIGTLDLPQSLLSMQDLCISARCSQMNPKLTPGAGLSFEAWVDEAGIDATWMDPKVRRVVFRTAPEKDLGSIAEEACLQFEIPGDTLTLTVEIGTNKIDLPLKALAGRIDVILANAPSTNPPFAPDPAHAEHIRYYYDMSRGATGADRAFLLNQKGIDHQPLTRHNHPPIIGPLIPNSSDCPPTGGWDPWP